MEGPGARMDTTKTPKIRTCALWCLSMLGNNSAWSLGSKNIDHWKKIKKDTTQKAGCPREGKVQNKQPKQPAWIKGGREGTMRKE